MNEIIEVKIMLANIESCLGGLILSLCFYLGDAIRQPSSEHNHYNKHDTSTITSLGPFFLDLLNIVDANSWSEVCGKCVRLEYQGNTVKGVGHITRNEWLYFKEDFGRKPRRMEDAYQTKKT